MTTQASDGVERTSQPQATVINIPLGGRALLRISDLNITENAHAGERSAFR